MNIILSILVGLIFNSNLIGIVESFHSLDSVSAEGKFLELHSKNDDPSVRAYVCAIEMKQAEHTYNPVNKIKIFRSSKAKLDSLIKENINNTHLRYMRLMLQETTPSFLGYNGNIKEDKLFLQHILSIEDETDFLDHYIYLNTSL